MGLQMAVLKKDTVQVLEGYGVITEPQDFGWQGPQEIMRSLVRSRLLSTLCHSRLWLVKRWKIPSMKTPELSQVTSFSNALLVNNHPWKHSLCHALRLSISRSMKFPSTDYYLFWLYWMFKKICRNLGKSPAHGLCFKGNSIQKTTQELGIYAKKRTQYTRCHKLFWFVLINDGYEKGFLSRRWIKKLPYARDGVPSPKGMLFNFPHLLATLHKVLETEHCTLTWKMV